MPKTHQTELRSINYGHFGTPFYDYELKKWSFSKLAPSNTRFVQLGATEELASGTGDSERQIFLRDQVHDLEDRYYASLEAEVRLLANGYPEMQPAEVYLKPLVRLSEGIAHALTEHDPATGDLLATGNISNSLENQNQTFKILAIPGSSCGEALRLIQLEANSFEYNDETFFDLDLPSGANGFWRGKGAPIQQVVFAKSLTGSNKNNILAVRLQGCIVMMYPRNRARQLPLDETTIQIPSQPSTIDPNVIFELHAREAQDVRFADLAFNPWKRREYAVIDTAAQWTLFTIERTMEKFPAYAPKKLQHGKMPISKDEESEDEDDERPQATDSDTSDIQEENPSTKSNQTFGDNLGAIETGTRGPDAASIASEPEGLSSALVPDVSEGHLSGDENESTNLGEADAIERPQSRQDGWVRLSWVLDSATLILCTRRAIRLVDVRTNHHAEIPKLLIPSSRSAGWHLDLRLCWDNPDHVFVLTSYSIFLIEVSRKASSGTDSDPPLAGKIVISALHFRDPADISMRMLVTPVYGNYIVAIHSQYNKIVSCFEVKIAHGQNERASISEAIPLLIPERANNRTLAVSLEVLSRSSGALGPAKETQKPSLSRSLHSIQFLGSDFALWHGFFEMMDFTNQRILSAPQLREAHRLAGNSNLFVDSDTDVQDAQSDESNSGLDDDLALTLYGSTLELGSGQREHAGQLKLACMDAAHDLDTPLGFEDNNVLPCASIGRISTLIDTAFESMEDVQGPTKTLFEHVGQAVPRVGELRDASFELEDAFANISLSAAVRMYPSAIPLPVTEEDSEDITFDDVYAHLEDIYVSPLGSGFPDAFSGQRERIARSVAAEIMLASARIERTGDIKEEYANNMDGTQFSDWYVGSSQPTEAFSSQEQNPRMGRTVLPTPSATEPGYSRSQSPYSAPVNSTMNEIVQRLQQRVTLNIGSTQQWSLRPMVMLSHWDLEANPDEYSYRETKKRLEEERDFGGLSEKQQRQKLKKQDRARIRKEREARKSQRLTQQSSQAPSIMSSQVPNAGSPVPVPSQSRAPVIGSQVGKARPSQIPGFGSPAPEIRSSQIPGFGSQKPSSLRHKNVPGFGSQSSQRPPKSKPMPGFGTPPATSIQGQGASKMPAKADRLGKEKLHSLEASRSQDDSSVAKSFQLPVRQTAVASSLHTTFQASSTPRSPTLSRRSPLSQSQRYASQGSSSQTPKKKKRRTEGF